MHRLTAEVFLIRHGETEWSRTGRHTGVTDIPLTDRGRRDAERLAPVLARAKFDLVLASPLQRARQTCELVGLGDRAQIDRDLVEWNYGEYEGLTSDEIERRLPGWMIFRDGCPGGESPRQVAARADRLIEKVRGVSGCVALLGHGHLFRVFAARWIGLPPDYGARFLLDTSTLNILGYYRGIPAIERWNAPIGDG